MDVLAPGGEQRQGEPEAVLHLLPGRDQLLVVEKLGGVADDGLVGPVVLAEEDLAREVLRVEIVKTFQQRLVQPLLGGIVRKNFRTELHVISSQDDPGSAGGHGEGQDGLGLHRLGGLIEQDVGEVAAWKANTAEKPIIEDTAVRNTDGQT